MNGHTPGPWRVEENELVIWGDCLDDVPGISGGVPIAMARTKWDSGNWAKRPGHEEAEANARLIASAPDLKADNDRLRAVNAELLEALEGLVPDRTTYLQMMHPDLLSLRLRAAHAAIAKARGTS